MPELSSRCLHVNKMTVWFPQGLEKNLNSRDLTNTLRRTHPDSFHRSAMPRSHPWNARINPCFPSWLWCGNGCQYNLPVPWQQNLPNCLLLLNWNTCFPETVYKRLA